MFLFGVCLMQSVHTQLHITGESAAGGLQHSQSEC